MNDPGRIIDDRSLGIVIVPQEDGEGATVSLCLSDDDDINDQFADALEAMFYAFRLSMGGTVEATTMYDRDGNVVE